MVVNIEKERIPNVLGIWTRFIVLYAFFAPGPAILVGYPGSADLELDTLAQL